MVQELLFATINLGHLRMPCDFAKVIISRWQNQDSYVGHPPPEPGVSSIWYIGRQVWKDWKSRGNPVKRWFYFYQEKSTVSTKTGAAYISRGGFSGLVCGVW